MSTISRPVSFKVADSTVARHIDTTGSLTFLYDTDQPYAVTLKFAEEEGQPWVFARDILADGLTGYAGRGDVHCATEGLWFSIALTTDDCGIRLAVLAEVVRAFLVDAEDLVPYGREVLDFDAELDLLLMGGGGR